MKKSIFAILLLAAGLQGALQDYPVTPATVGDWQIVGANPEEFSHSDKLILPRGVELSRRFRGGAALLQSISSPDFGAAEADWPLFQVGPLGLALIREGNRGELALLLGDSVSTLPGGVALDANGRTLESLEIVLGYDPISQLGLVAFAGHQLWFKGNESATSIEMAVSSGANHPWAQETLTVWVIGPEDDAANPTQGSKDEKAKKSALLESIADKLREVGGRGAGLKGRALGDKLAESHATVSTLEVFTPPSVRHRSETVRAAIAQARKK